MTKEQLLIPRYLCTGTPGKPLWYGCHWKHGDIIQMEDTMRGLCCVYADDAGTHFKGQPYFADFPHLFKPLQWWEYRKPEEMPEYVLTAYKNESVGNIMLANGIVFKVEKWVTDTFIWVDGEQILAHLEGYKPSYLSIYREWENGRVNAVHLLPATREEYEQYLKQKEAQS